MQLNQKAQELIASIKSDDLDAYLNNLLSYSDIETLFSQEKLGGTNLRDTLRMEIFYLINEDIALNSFGNSSAIGLSESIMHSTQMQMYRKKGNEYIPIGYDINKANSSYVRFESQYISPSLLLGLDYLKGNLSPKTKKLHKLYNIQTAVALNDRPSYKNIKNLNDEIERILYLVSPESPDPTLEIYDDNGNIDVTKTINITYNTTGKILKYDDNDITFYDSVFVKFIKDISHNEFAKEFMNINGIPGNMLRSNHIALYSALLNFSKSELESSTIYLNYLKSIYPENMNRNIYSNWDSIRVLFERFLKELSIRTIHY